MTWDAIVVGARCAGSPTAMLLARKGYRVLLVDRRVGPADTLSTHLVWQPGVARLARWGLLDRIVASNCPAIRTTAFDAGNAVVTGVPPPFDGARDAFAPRRRVLDKILADAAVEAGAELCESLAVQELVTDGDAVVGIRGRARSGLLVDERAHVVVGADGAHSTIARLLRAPVYDAKPALTSWYYTYWSGVTAAGTELFSRPGRAIGAIPTNDGLVCVFVVWPRTEFDRVRADVEASYLASLALAPGLAERVRAGRREERFYGTADLPNFFRKPWGPGWALVGDAGYHKDPITAQGIGDAFRDAELLVDALDDALSGRRPLEAALADYQRRRDVAAQAMYAFTGRQAALEPPSPAEQRLFAALARNRAEADRFVGALAGTVAIPDFFSDDNRRRITAADAA